MRKELGKAGTQQEEEEKYPLADPNLIQSLFPRVGEIVLWRQATKAGQPAVVATCTSDGHTWGEQSSKPGDHPRPGHPKGTDFSGEKERSTGELSGA